MSRVDIYRLETGNTYRIVKSQRDTDLLDYVHDDTGQKRSYLLARPALLPQRRPGKLQCWEDLLQYKPAQGEGAPSKWMVVTHGDDGIALGRGGPLSKEERDELLATVELVSVQRAAAGASKGDIVSRWTGMTMTIIVGLAVLLTIVIVLVGLAGYLSSQDGVEQPTQEQEYVVEPPATPGPLPTPPVQDWQNPRIAP